MSYSPQKPSNIPPEIVYEILTYQFKDFMNNDQPSTSEKFNENLRNFVRSNLTVNKTFYHICRILIYKYCNFTTAKRFHSLLSSITEHPELRNIIQVADFQELTSIGLGRSIEMNREIKNLTNDTLLRFINLTKSNLREFLACEHIQGDLDEKIIYALLKPNKVLSILDFCGCSGVNFTRSFILALRKLYPTISLTSTPAQSESGNNTLTTSRNVSTLSLSSLSSTANPSESSPDGLQEDDLTISMDDMDMEQNPLEYNYQITCLGLNDCTDLPSFVVGRILKLLPELQKLDLSHTSIDDNVLLNGMPHLKNLTHLSLANCSQLTPRAVLEFFSHHPAVTDENNSVTLEWLNLSVITHSSSWNEVHTMFLLKKLCQFGHNKTLQYLNIGDLPLHQMTTSEIAQAMRREQGYEADRESGTNTENHNNSESIFSTVVKRNKYYQCHDTLIFIKLNFPKLKSLSVKGNNIPIPRLVEFLRPLEQSIGTEKILETMKEQQKLKFLNISNNSHINKWTIEDPAILTCSNSLVALEISFDAWNRVEKANPDSEIVAVKYNRELGKNELIKWRCYKDTSFGRRYFIFKTDPHLNREDYCSVESSLTKFDEHGNKIIKVYRQPDFLKFAQNKISLSVGLVLKSGYRRKHCYRDVRPPISEFLSRTGGISFGNTLTPQMRLTLPPGAWRLLPEQHEGGTNDVHNSGPNDVAGPHTATTHHHPEIGSALYWDRSYHDLRSLSGSPLPSPASQSNEEPNTNEDLNGTVDGEETEREDQPLALRSRRSSRHTSTLPSPLEPQFPRYEEQQEAEQTDEEYLTNPDLQRRRSQLQLGFLRTRSHSHPHRLRHGHRSPHQSRPSSPLANEITKRSLTTKQRSPFSQCSTSDNHTRSRISPHSSSATKQTKKPKGYYYAHPEEFIYDPNDPVTTKRYQIHFECVNEYKTFGCIERGMYRYYSLRM